MRCAPLSKLQIAPLEFVRQDNAIKIGIRCQFLLVALSLSVPMNTAHLLIVEISL